MIKTHTEQLPQFTLQNNLYEPLVIRYINPLTEQIASQDVLAHQKIPMELKKWLFEQRLKVQSESASSHITSDEKSKE